MLTIYSFEKKPSLIAFFLELSMNAGFLLNLSGGMFIERLRCQTSLNFSFIKDISYQTNVQTFLTHPPVKPEIKNLVDLAFQLLQIMVIEALLDDLYSNNDILMQYDHLFKRISNVTLYSNHLFDTVCRNDDIINLK